MVGKWTYGSLPTNINFSHEAIIKYCNRPFFNSKEMDSEIISRFNSVVKVNDLTYHLGDFSFKNPNEYLKKLNGNHCLIIGNHDAKQHHGFQWAKDSYLLKNVLPNFNIFLSHYAHRVWPHSHHGTLHLFAHSHGNLPSFGRSFDIGVDTNNFYPYSLDEVIIKARTLTPEFMVCKDPLKEI